MKKFCFFNSLKYSLVCEKVGAMWATVRIFCNTTLCKYLQRVWILQTSVDQITGSFWRSLFICVTRFTSYLGITNSFPLRWALWTFIVWQLHNNLIIREINNSPADIKFWASIAVFSEKSSDFYAPSCLSLLFFYPSPTSEVKIYPKGVSLSSSHLHTFLVGSAKFPQRCSAVLTCCGKG